MLSDQGKNRGGVRKDPVSGIPKIRIQGKTGITTRKVRFCQRRLRQKGKVKGEKQRKGEKILCGVKGCTGGSGQQGRRRTANGKKERSQIEGRGGGRRDEGVGGGNRKGDAQRTQSKKGRRIDQFEGREG